MERRSWLARMVAAVVAMVLPWRSPALAEVVDEERELLNPVLDELLWKYPVPLTEDKLVLLLHKLRLHTGRQPYEMRGNSKAILAYLRGVLYTRSNQGERRYTTNSSVGYENSELRHMAPGISLGIIHDEVVPDGVFAIRFMRQSS